jgi:hypothetical protein
MTWIKYCVFAHYEHHEPIAPMGMLVLAASSSSVRRQESNDLVRGGFDLSQ